MPNKIFEHIKAGLPVIASDFPEIKSPVNQNNCGWTSEVDENVPSQIILDISEPDIADKQIVVSNAATDLDWEKKARLFINSYPISGQSI